MNCEYIYLLRNSKLREIFRTICHPACQGTKNRFALVDTTEIFWFPKQWIRNEGGIRIFQRFEETAEHWNVWKVKLPYQRGLNPNQEKKL